MSRIHFLDNQNTSAANECKNHFLQHPKIFRLFLSQCWLETLPTERTQLWNQIMLAGACFAQDREAHASKSPWPDQQIPPSALLAMSVQGVPRHVELHFPYNQLRLSMLRDHRSSSHVRLHQLRFSCGEVYLRLCLHPHLCFYIQPDLQTCRKYESQLHSNLPFSSSVCHLLLRTYCTIRLGGALVGGGCDRELYARYYFFAHFQFHPI